MYGYVRHNFDLNVQLCVFRASAKAAVILLPVLGLTWVFGLLAVNEDTVVFAWIFTVINSLQVISLPKTVT